MAQTLSISIHDNLDEDPRDITIISGQLEHIPPYHLVHIGPSVTIFLTTARLGELRDKISEYIAQRPPLTQELES